MKTLIQDTISIVYIALAVIIELPYLYKSLELNHVIM